MFPSGGGFRRLRFFGGQHFDDNLFGLCLPQFCRLFVQLFPQLVPFARRRLQVQGEGGRLLLGGRRALLLRGEAAVERGGLASQLLLFTG